MENCAISFLKLVLRCYRICVDICNVNWPKNHLTVCFRNSQILIFVILSTEYKGHLSVYNNNNNILAQNNVVIVQTFK